MNGIEATVGGTVQISFDFEVDPAGTGFSIVSSANIQNLDMRIIFLSNFQCPSSYPFFKSDGLTCVS